MNDNRINHPDYYNADNGMETIDVIDTFTKNLNGIEAVDTGNILKYICRWKKKNGVEDLKKAQWYLSHLIQHETESHPNHFSDMGDDMCASASDREALLFELFFSSDPESNPKSTTKKKRSSFFDVDFSDAASSIMKDVIISYAKKIAMDAMRITLYGDSDSEYDDDSIKNRSRVSYASFSDPERNSHRNPKSTTKKERRNK